SRALNEIEKELRYSSDEELGKAALYGRVFRKTPYEHLETGTVAGLKAISLEDVKTFHAAYYSRDNLSIGLGGAFGENMVDRFQSDLQRLAAGNPELVDRPRPAPIRGRQVVLVEKPGTRSTAISLGYPIDLNRGSREFYALWLANSWLGEHRNGVSRLYQVIREARGMNYGDYSYIEAFPYGGRRNMPPTGVGRRQQLFEVWIRPVPEARALFALRAAIREVERLARDGLTREQFDTQKGFLKKYHLQFATTTSARLGYALDDRFYGIEMGHLARFGKMMDEITLEDVNAAIRKYMQMDNMVIAMVTGDGAAMKKALISGQPTPIDYGEIQKSEKILQEDREIAAFPLNIQARSVTIIPVEEMFER
ncbi:MAG: insulinase family protein, partial [Acidobacteriota bacterium]